MMRTLAVDEVVSSPEPAVSRPCILDQVSIGFASTVDEALAQAHSCDMMLISAALPDDGALKIVRAIRETGSPVRILVMDLAEGEHRATPYMEAGAAGWIV